MECRVILSVIYRLTPCLHMLCRYCVEQTNSTRNRIPSCPICKYQINYCIKHNAYPADAEQSLLDITTLETFEPTDYETYYYTWNPSTPFSIPYFQLHTCCLCLKPNRLAYQFSCCNAEYCSHCFQMESHYRYLVCSICSYCPKFIYAYFHHPRRALLTVTNTPIPQVLPMRYFRLEQQSSLRIEFPIYRFSPSTIIPPSPIVYRTPLPHINVSSLLHQPSSITSPRYRVEQIDNLLPELPLSLIPSISYSPPIPYTLQQEWYPVLNRCSIDLIADLAPPDFLASIQFLNYADLPTHECTICLSARVTIVQFRCYHPICATCFNKLRSYHIQKLNQSGATHVAFQDGIPCPYCRQLSTYYHFSYTYDNRTQRLCHWLNPINDATLTVKPRILSYIDVSTQTEQTDSTPTDQADSVDRILFQRGEKC